MKKIIPLIALLFLTYCLVSCGNKSLKRSVSKNDTTINKPLISSDSSAAKNEPNFVITNFLNWYHDNRANLMKIQMVNNANLQTFDSTKFYSVNFPETEVYLNTLKKTGFISDIYIDNWRDYFRNADAHFKQNPQNDGPPDYFDYDFILLSQETDDDLENINKINFKSKTVQGDKSLMLIQFPSSHKLKFALSRTKARWLIDNIEIVEEK